MLKRVSSLILALILFTGSTYFIAKGEDEPGTVTAVPSARLTDTRVIPADPTGSAKGAELTMYDTLIVQNNRFELYLDETDLVVKLKDKANNYIWSSAPAMDKMSSLNFEWQRMATSLLTAEYLNPAGAISRSPLKHSNARAPEITKTASGFSAKVEFYEAKIGLTVNVELTDKGLRVSIPDSSIIQKGDNMLHKLYIMPFLGATLGDEIPGYVFIPDGSGALIRFSKPRPYLSSFSGRVYGQDYAMKRPLSITMVNLQAEKMNLNMPVFGVSHGGRQNAFVADAVSGDAFMEIEASPAGATTDFTWASAKFIYRAQYTQPTSKSGGAFTALQPNTNKVDAIIDYTFLSGDDADYVGMAKAYREKLKKAGVLTTQVKAGSPVKLKVEAVMAEPTKGLITNRTEVMTRLNDVRRWTSELGSSGIPSISMVLWGFEKGGVSGHSLNTFDIDSSIGSKQSMEALYDQLSGTGSELILRKEIQSGYQHQIDRSRLAYHIDGGVLEKFDATSPLFQRLYYLNTGIMKESVQAYEKNPPYMKNMALTSVASNLFSDYRRNKEIYRDKMIGSIDNMLETANNNTGTLALYSPNVYAFKHADVVYDIPMQNSQFVYETDTVPFIQIVLSGSKEYYAPHLNFGTNTINDVLKLIDYGAYPSYVLTEQYSSRLASTNLKEIYSSRYEDWKPYIVNNYKMINNILSRVKGKAINKRIIPENGISIVEYEGGTAILINYTKQSYTYENQTVDALSARIVKE